jgi:nucleoside-diphosphate-sugar epimerase
MSRSAALSARRIVVTGAKGFVGGHLTRTARDHGADVLSVLRSDGASPDAVSMKSILADPALLDGTDLLVHAAAVRHRHGASAKDYRASNVDLVEALVRAAAGRIGRFVFVSSVGVYGFPAELPITEETPLAPATLYSSTKVDAERLVARLATELRLPYTIIRPTIVYGPGDTNGMMDKLARMIRARRYLVVGSGSNVLHHTFVADVVDGILTLGQSERARNDHFIVAGPERTTLSQLSELVAHEVGGKVPSVHVPLRLARAVATAIDAAAARGLAFSQREPPINHEKLDVMTVSISFDASKARSAGFAPRVGYAEGIARTFGGDV